MSDELKKFKETWQKQSQSLIQSDHLSKEEIMDFISNQSRQVTAGYRKGLLFDIVWKALLTFSFLILAFLFNANGNMVIMNIVLMICTAVILLMQTKYYQHAALSDNADNSIKEFLKYKVEYFNRDFVKAIYLIALSGPLFFISSGLFYFYFKYGYVRPLDAEDYTVFGAGVLLAFLTSVIAQVRQYKFQLEQLTACLNDLDEKQISRIEQKKSRNRRIVNTLFWSGMIILILLAVTYFFATV